jgi:hypothetical protein
MEGEMLKIRTNRAERFRFQGVSDERIDVEIKFGEVGSDGDDAVEVSVSGVSINFEPEFVRYDTEYGKYGIDYRFSILARDHGDYAIAILGESLKRAGELILASHKAPEWVNETLKDGTLYFEPLDTESGEDDSEETAIPF